MTRSAKHLLVWLPLFIAAVSWRAEGAQVSFTTPASYATEKAPLWVTTGDFNGDGKLDLAVADGGSDAVTILLGNGDGTFQTGVSYSAGVNFAINYLVTGDFNKDGKQDLLVGTFAGTVLAVLPGKGDGTFGPAILTQLSLNMLMGNILEGGTVQGAVADFNGDGNLDIAMFLGSLNGKSFSGITAYLLRGNGDGTFQSPEPIVALAGMETISFATADFNGDGKPDLAVLALNSGATSANLVIALGQGDGTFRVANTYQTPIGADVTVGDVNGDGAPDVVLSGAFFELGSEATEGIAVFTGKGDGSFQLAASYTLAPDTFILAMCLADVRGTGTPDIVAAQLADGNGNNIADAAGSIILLEGNGDGTYQNPVELLPLVATVPFTMVSGDFNGDGRPDLAFAAIPNSQLAAISNEGSISNLAGNILAALAAFSNGTVEAVLDTTPPASFSDANAAGFQRGSMAQDSIVAAFGGGLSSQTVVASGTLGTSLGGVTVNVKDSTGTSRAADLFYVSPSQINYAIPAGTATGAAVVSIASGTNTATANQQIVSVLPGIFAVNGIAAANVDTYQGSKLTSTGLAFQVAANGDITLAPIDVSTGEVYLLMYGTGIRNASSVTVNLGTQTGLPVAYHGAQGTFVGEDQINVLLPSTLQGAGVINVTLTADGQTSNAVQIQIQ
ncbi:MAG: FG-GAP-like repeat-containing protein [Bryobacteraceae bacterium]|jgi:uncharacterized protein (TIGR03437 family)